MRHHYLLVLLLLAVPTTAEGQPIGQRLGGAGDSEYYTLRAGSRWMVFATKPPRFTGGSPDLLVKSSLDDPSAETFVTFPARSVDELVAEGILPAWEAEEIREDLAAEGRDYRQADDLFVVHMEVAMDPRGQISNKLSIPGFGWEDPETLNEFFDWNDPGSPETFNVDESFEGDVDVDFPLNGVADITVNYRLKKKFGVPYKFRLLEASVLGEAKISQGKVTASGSFSYTEEWHWKKNIINIHLGDVIFVAGFIPVILRFDLPIDIGFDARVKVEGQATLTADLDGTARFDVICTASQCEGDTAFEEALGLSEPTYEISLDATARVWARVAVEMAIYDESFGLVSAGATGYVEAHLFGYLGNLCGDSDGDGSEEHLEDLLLDVDAGYVVDVRMSGFLLPQRTWTLLEDNWHLLMLDLWDGPGGRNLADPLVVGSTDLMVGETGLWEIRNRPCFPYSDPLEIQWSGPFTGTGSLTPNSDPLVASAQVPEGDHSLVVTSVGDAHGRTFGASSTFPVKVRDPYGPTVVLSNNVPQAGLGSPAGSRSLYSIEVTEGASHLVVELSGGSGNANLYVSRDTRPDPAGSNDCVSANEGNSDTCSFPAPAAGIYNILVDAPSGYSGATLVAHYIEPTAEALTVGVPFTGLAGDQDSRAYFTLEVPPGATDLRVDLSGGIGDADLFVRARTWAGPTTEASDCASREVGNEDGCWLPLPEGGTYYFLIHGFSAFSGASLVATYTAPGGELANGVPETGLSGGSGGQIFYSIELPPGAHDLRIELEGDLGDADLYVRFGALPSRILHDCSSSTIGSSDSCTIRSPQAGRYFILIYGYVAYSDVTLTASYIGAQPLFDEAPVTGLEAPTLAETFFTIEVPEGALDLEVMLSTEVGDADLYVRFDAQPDRDDLDATTCASQNPAGEVDTCAIPFPQAGRYHILVYAFEAYSGGTLVADYVEPAGGELVNGVSEEELAAIDDSEVFFTLDLPQDATDLSVQIFGGTGDADLYVRYGLQPSIDAYDCRSWKEGNSDNCFFATPEAGTWHILVHGYSDYADLSLVATYSRSLSEGGELFEGTPETNLSGQEDSEVAFMFELLSPAQDLTFTLANGAGDADLYIKLGEPPTTESFDCQAWEIGSDETCVFDTAQAGIYHLLVHGFGDYSGVDLSVTFKELGPDVLFLDGFESGNVEMWSLSSPVLP